MRHSRQAVPGAASALDCLQGDEEGLPEGLRKLQVTRSSSPQRTGDERCATPPHAQPPSPGRLSPSPAGARSPACSPRSVAALSRYSSHDSSLPEQSAQLAGPAMAAAGASTPLQQASLRVRSDGGWEAPLLPPVRVAAAPAGSARRSALAAELARGNAFISTIPLPGWFAHTAAGHGDDCCCRAPPHTRPRKPQQPVLAAACRQRVLHTSARQLLPGAAGQR